MGSEVGIDREKCIDDISAGTADALDSPCVLTGDTRPRSQFGHLPTEIAEAAPTFANDDEQS